MRDLIGALWGLDATWGLRDPFLAMSSTHDFAWLQQMLEEPFGNSSLSIKTNIARHPGSYLANGMRYPGSRVASHGG